MNHKELIELAERCEAATGPDRELDAEIATAIGWANVSPAGHGFVGHCPNRFFGSVPSFTASLDAAMALVPEGCRPLVAQNLSDGRFHAIISHLDETWYHLCREAATPALALCAAALRALNQPKGEDE